MRAVLKNIRDLVYLLAAAVTLLVLRAYVFVRRLPSATFRDEDGEPYMTRYFLTRASARAYLETGKSGHPGTYLHHFHRGDYDRRLHNHPWEWSWSWILSGGYIEERLRATPAMLSFWKAQGFVSLEPHLRFQLAGSLNRIGANDFHRAILVQERIAALPLFLYRGTWPWWARLFWALMGRQTWTLFRAGPKHGRRWGFLQGDGTVTRAPEYDARTLREIADPVDRLCVAADRLRAASGDDEEPTLPGVKLK